MSRAPYRRGSPSERFWAKVRVGSPDECWEWAAAVAGPRVKYGVFKGQHGTVRAHRFAYEDAVGPIPPGLHIMHLCDNPLCCNPSHLRPGTQQQNNADMVSKGRSFVLSPMAGSQHPLTHLSEEDVVAIRERYAKGGTTQTELGREFNLDQTTVSDIVRRKSWGHV